MGCKTSFTHRPKGMQLCSPVFTAHIKLDLAPGEGKGRTSTKHVVKTRVKTKHFWGCWEVWFMFLGHPFVCLFLPE